MVEYENGEQYLVYSVCQDYELSFAATVQYGGAHGNLTADRLEDHDT